MASINVKVPDGMAEDIDEFLDETPHYMNRSEFVRDTIRRYLEERPLHLSERTLEDDRISRQQIRDGDVVALDEL